MYSILLVMIPTFVCQLSPGMNSQSVMVAGKPRDYKVYIPTGIDHNNPHPMLLIFHGYNESPTTMASDTGLNEKAEQTKFIAVYPAGTGKMPSWNAGTCCNPDSDDVGFVRVVLKDIASSVKVDDKRIYAVGMSNGAMMASRLACEMSDTFAAVATIAGTTMVDDCLPSRPVPTIHFHGTNDHVIPFDGTRGKLPGLTPSVSKHIEAWIKRNEAEETPIILELSSTPMKVTQKQHLSSGIGSADVVLIEIEGGGHLWPGRPRPVRFSKPEEKQLLGETAQNISANDLIWEFFQKHHLP